MKELFSLASRQLGRKKLRVFLIVLGIAIGVAAVIGVTSLGEGIRVQAVEQIKASHDLTAIDVSAGVEAGSVTLITDSKLKAIKTEKHVLFAAPYVQDSYVIDIKYARALDEKDSYDGLFVKVDDPAFAASVRDKR